MHPQCLKQSLVGGRSIICICWMLADTHSSEPGPMVRKSTVMMLSLIRTTAVGPSDPQHIPEAMQLELAESRNTGAETQPTPWSTGLAGEGSNEVQVGHHNYMQIYVGYYAILWGCGCSVAKSCPTLFNPMDYSLDFPGKNTIMGCHFLLQGSSQPRDRTCISCLGREILYHWATREAHLRYR